MAVAYLHVLAVISGYTGSNPHLFTMALLSRAPGNYTLTISNLSLIHI